MTEATRVALRRREQTAFDRHEFGLLDRLDDQLGDPVPSLHLIVLRRIGVDQENRQFAPIAGIDETGGVEARNAVPQRQPTAGKDEAGIANRQGQHDARWDECPATAGRELDIFSSVEIGTSIPGVGVTRHREAGVELVERDDDHRKNLVGLRADLTWTTLVDRHR